MTVTVLIADDQDMVRAALRAILDRRPDLEVVGEAADGERAVALAAELRPDVVLMDVRMPGLTGVEATRRIIGAAVPSKILVLTTFDLDEYVQSALRAGASGFLLKNASPEQLCDAVRAVAAGNAVLAPAVTRRIAEALQAPPASADGRTALAALTARELEVLVLVGRGLSNARIARTLDLSESGVKSRVNRILTRLGLENRVQAALLAREAGLLDELP
ncbi:response regulator transcription factor [Dactylosporangium sp. NPDC050588]|uniref:response regulator transcription factor n=1 Tax=Dactylosporangium sp. NPDC050588 TaxID=3157211 RepID=UPI0033D79FFE